MFMRQRILWAFLVVICVQFEAVAADLVIHGKVTDEAGGPIRGAIVKAAAGNKAISRYTQNDGRYEITVPAGAYDVSVTAYGYRSKRQSVNAALSADTNFLLASGVDVMRLSGADLETLLPDNRETRLIKQECIACHNLSNVIKHRGNTAEEWRTFLPIMVGRYQTDEAPMWSPGMFAALTVGLEKYFRSDAPFGGSDADPPAAEPIQHAKISDATLSATFREYQIPGDKQVMSHSISIDPSGKTAWFSEGNINKIGRFNVQDETFQSYDVPPPGSSPHTPVVGPDGVVWMALAGHGAVKLVSVDPKTEQVKAFSWPEQKYPAHTPTLGPGGTLWLSNFAPGQVWSLDLKTQEFRVLKFPIPQGYPDASTGALELTFGPPASSDRFTGLPTAEVNAWPYHIAEDSNGTLWFGSLFLGTITSLDPVSGRSKVYQPQGAPSTRGIAVDAQDNVWFSNFHGHRLGRIDAKTRAIKQYELPTKNATGYGVVYEKRTGYLWIADMNGNNITSFDPKKEEFVEYPIPTHQAVPRFISLDDSGRVWFTEFFGGNIGVLIPAGVNGPALRAKYSSVLTDSENR
jgi:streptogramin lyase